MSSIKDKLKQQAKSKLAVNTGQHVQVVQKSVQTDIDKITYEIKSDLDEMREIQEWWQAKKARVEELKIIIIDKLIYVRDNKKTLLKGMTFDTYLADVIGISKGYFYDTARALEIAKEFKKPRLLEHVDPKVLLMSKKFEDKEVQRAIVNRAENLSRDDVKALQQNENITPDDVNRYIPIAERQCHIKKSKESITIISKDPEIISEIDAFIKQKGYV